MSRCSSGQVLSKVSRRCIKKCKSGQRRDSSNRCVSRRRTTRRGTTRRGTTKRGKTKRGKTKRGTAKDSGKSMRKNYSVLIIFNNSVSSSKAYKNLKDNGKNYGVRLRRGQYGNLEDDKYIDCVVVASSKKHVSDWTRSVTGVRRKEIKTLS